MPTIKDPYEVLGVPRQATKAEIKKAFRRLARKYHPDVAKDKKAGEERIKEINEAYEVLGDLENRRKYDQIGASAAREGRWRQDYQRREAQFAEGLRREAAWRRQHQRHRENWFAAVGIAICLVLWVYYACTELFSPAPHPAAQATMQSSQLSREASAILYNAVVKGTNAPPVPVPTPAATTPPAVIVPGSPMDTWKEKSREAQGARESAAKLQSLADATGDTPQGRSLARAAAAWGLMAEELQAQADEARDQSLSPRAIYPAESSLYR
jgi:hypothetical protein